MAFTVKWLKATLTCRRCDLGSLPLSLLQERKLKVEKDRACLWHSVGCSRCLFCQVSPPPPMIYALPAEHCTFSNNRRILKSMHFFFIDRNLFPLVFSEPHPIVLEKEKYILLRGIFSSIFVKLYFVFMLKSVCICFKTTILSLLLAMIAKILYNIAFTLSSQRTQERGPLPAPLMHPAAMLAGLMALHLLQPPVLSVLMWGPAFQGHREQAEQLTNIFFKTGNH